MNLPNKLTIFRIILIPFFILILAAPIFSGSVTIAGTVIGNARWVATIIFIVASLTDFFGWANCPEKAFSHQLWKICGSFG